MSTAMLILMRTAMLIFRIILSIVGAAGAFVMWLYEKRPYRQAGK